MGSILVPGFVRWDGFKYVLDPSLEGPPGPPGTPGSPGSDGNAILIYKPGGTASGNVYTSWTALMAKRATIPFPMTIVIDDSIVSPAPVDVGIWDLTLNTTIHGYRFTEHLGNVNPASAPRLSIPNNAILLNPYAFKNVGVTGFAQTGYSIDFTNPSGGSNIIAENTQFYNDSTATAPTIHAAGGAIQLYGNSRIVQNGNGSFVVSNTAIHPVVIELYDSSVIDGYTLQFNNSLIPLTININSPSAVYTVNQPGISISVTINGANFDPTNFGSATVGNVLTKTGIAQASWLPASGGVSGDNFQATRPNFQKRYQFNDQWAFESFIDTGLQDSGGSLAGTAIDLSLAKVFYVGMNFNDTPSPDLYSVEIAGERTDKMTAAINLAPTATCSDLITYGISAIDGTGIAMVYPTGVNIVGTYERNSASNETFRLANYPAGAENWTGGRLAYRYESESTVPYVHVFWTAPAAGKIYVADTFGSAVGTALSAGGTPGAICIDNNGNVWVAFGSTINKYTAVNSGTSPFLPLLGATSVSVLVTGVPSHMIFDGQYIWVVCNDGSIHKFDTNGNNQVNVNLNSQGYLINANSRMAFDGLRIWVTSGRGILAVDPDNLFVGFSESQFVFGQTGAGLPCRGVCVDRDGVVYAAFMATVPPSSTPTLQITKWDPAGGGLPAHSRRRVSRVFLDSSAGSIFPAITSINAVTLHTNAYSNGTGNSVAACYEVKVVASKTFQVGGHGYARWRFLIDVTPNNTANIVTIDSYNNATSGSNLWVVTFSYNSSSKVLTGTAALNGDTGIVNFTFDILETREDGEDT